MPIAAKEHQWKIISNPHSRKHRRNHCPFVGRPRDIAPAHQPASGPAFGNEALVHFSIRHPITGGGLAGRTLLFRRAKVGRAFAVLGIARPAMVELMDHLRLVERYIAHGARPTVQKRQAAAVDLVTCPRAL